MSMIQIKVGGVTIKLESKNIQSITTGLTTLYSLACEINIGLINGSLYLKGTELEVKKAELEILNGWER